MGDQHQHTATTPEDRAIERAEQQLTDPTAQNMQFLQSSVAEIPQTPEPAMAPLPSSIQRIGPGASNSPSSGLSAPAYSGASLVGGVAAVDLASAGSAMGVAAQVASAAPTILGKAVVAPSVAVSQVPASNALAAKNGIDDVPAARATGHQPYVPTSEEFQHLQHLLDSSAGSDISTDALMSLLGAPGQEADAASLQAAIDQITDQLALLNDTFAPVFEDLNVDVAATKGTFSDLSSTDLGVTILSDASSVSTSLSDLLGTSNLSSNPQLGSLLNLGSTVDDVVSLVGSLPDLTPLPDSNLTLDPVIQPITDIVGGVLDPVTEPITDIVGGVLDPVTEPITDIVGGVLDPVTEPITDIVGGVLDPVAEPITDIVGGVLDPVTEPITDIVGGVLDPVTEPIIEGVEGVLPGLGVLSGTVTTAPQPDGGSGGDSSLLGSITSGISSSASGSESGSVGVPGADFDPTK